MPKLLSLDSPIKRHGGKAYLAKRIVAMMPPRAANSGDPFDGDGGWLHYVEPYFGSGDVLFELDPRGISEVVNDLDGELTNFWDTLQDQETFAEFARLASATPVSEVEYVRACVGNGTTSVSRAKQFFVRNRQSRQALEMDFLTLTRNRTRRGMQEACSAWLSAVDGLPAVHERLRRVLILNRPATDVVRQQDGPKTLFYLDPPYVHETRTVVDAYKHEMTLEQHGELLALLAAIKGRFLLSGYHSRLYDEAAARHGWRCEEIEIDNKAGSGATKRTMTECVWRNYA